MTWVSFIPYLIQTVLQSRAVVGTGHAKTYNPAPVPAIVAWETSWEAWGPTISMQQDTGWNVDLDEGKWGLRGKRPSCNCTKRWHLNEVGARQGQTCEQRQSRKREPHSGRDGRWCHSGLSRAWDGGWEFSDRGREKQDKRHGIPGGCTALV